MRLRCHARYLPRRAVEWKANCGGKIAPLQRRQVRCVCSISLSSWRKMLASVKLPGNNSVCEISRMYFDSHERAVSACMYMHRASTNTSDCKPSIRSSSVCRLCRSLRPLPVPRFDSFSLCLPLIYAPLMSREHDNNTI